jgi:hypothetical protein
MSAPDLSRAVDVASHKLCHPGEQIDALGEATRNARLKSGAVEG